MRVQDRTVLTDSAWFRNWQEAATWNKVVQIYGRVKRIDNASIYGNIQHC